MKLIKYFLILVIFVGGFLRFYKIDSNPPGLYIDEVSIGYNAYKILTTGRDEHGEVMPLFFKAFGEYKMPVYIYTTAASMALFGKNEFAIRFPSAASGTITLFTLFMLIKLLVSFDKNKKNDILRKYLPVLSTLLLAISSWHIHFSRGGFEVSLGLFLYITGLYLTLKFIENQKNLYLVTSALLIILSMYTYNTFRIISPLTWFLIISAFVIQYPKRRSKILTIFFTSILLIFPIFWFSITSGGAVRFSQTSTFSEYKAETVPEKIALYPMIYLKNYVSFFSTDYLFNLGDGNGRHQVPGFGLLYRWQLPFLIIGFGYVLKEKNSLFKYFLLGLLIISPLPAALTRPSPHSLRSLMMVVPFVILISIGIIIFIQHVRKWKLHVLVFVTVLAIYECSIYLHYYYSHYPKVNVLDWGGGNKQLVQKLSKYKGEYDYLVIDSKLNFTYLYIEFYDGSVNPINVEYGWKKPKIWNGKKVLYIRPNYGHLNNKQIIDKTYLPRNSNDVYAEFWRL